MKAKKNMRITERTEVTGKASTAAKKKKYERRLNKKKANIVDDLKI